MEELCHIRLMRSLLMKMVFIFSNQYQVDWNHLHRWWQIIYTYSRSQTLRRKLLFTIIKVRVRTL
ncbi:hypothetical protein EVA_13829 [gut metagenome]|uniref:Uncharacterized protein n=1 Tax=gut metagenome TaxID=749906 RepID=J9GFF9_9ZZZZ